MKFTIIPLLLGLFSSIITTTVFSCGYSQETLDQLTPHINRFKLEEVFTSTYPIKDKEELRNISLAYHYGRNLLDNKQIEQALPYLVYAERHGDPESFVKLYLIAKHQKYCNRISEQSRKQLLKNIPPPELYNELYDTYYALYKHNINALYRQSSWLPAHLMAMGKGYMYAWLHKNKISQKGISSKDLVPQLELPVSPEVPQADEFLVPLLTQDKNQDKNKVKSD